MRETFPEMNFIFSDEEDAIETGGGIHNALPLMNNEPFFVINSDALWADVNNEHLLKELAAAWDDEKHDILLMMQPINQAFGCGNNGDYTLDDRGCLQRRRDAETKAPYLYGGVMICHPRVFDNEEKGRYSLVRVFDRLEKEGRLGHYVHKGEWYHVGDPKAKEIAEKKFGQNDAKDNLLNKIKYLNSLKRTK